MLKELAEMEKEGVIEPSMSEWASPMVLVKKKDGSLRMCVDYCRLNSVSRADAYPMPHIDELIDRPIYLYHQWRRNRSGCSGFGRYTFLAVN